MNRSSKYKRKGLQTLMEPCVEYLSFSNFKYAMTLSTHLTCVGGLFDFHCRIISRRASKEEKANASDWPSGSKRFSDATPNTATIGSGSISFSQMYENVSNTADQNGPRAGHVQNIWPKLASPLWHVEHIVSISGNILASLLLGKCSLWILKLE